MLAEQLLRDCEPASALLALQEEVRAKPQDSRLRIFLFQLLCILGDWRRAHTQLSVLADLDPATLAMVEMYRGALHCEALRADVFAGRRTPLVLGEPLPWLGHLVEALKLEASACYGVAVELRQAALEQARTVPGEIDGAAFDWIADADSRLGPVCELILNGKYYWVPFERIERLSLEVPEDLRDVVWLPAHIRFANGGESVALVPSRYPHSENDLDSAIQLGRKTLWDEVAPGSFHSRGQRMFATSGGEYPLLTTRLIELRPAPNS